MHEMNARFRAIRKHAGLKQLEFGKRLGVGNAAISKIEIGESNLTEQMIISVCREFGISETWLRTGEGKMESETPDGLVQQVADAFNLDELARSFVEVYVNLPEVHRTAVNEFILSVANKHAATIEAAQPPRPEPGKIRCASRYKLLP